MARATATWTDTDPTEFEEGDFLTAANVLAHILQNLEWFAQSHDHSGDLGGESKLKDGATLTAGTELLIWYLGPASGS